jgi:hypothetical protein
MILCRTIMTNIMDNISSINALRKILGIMTAFDPPKAQISVFTTFVTKNLKLFLFIGASQM